MIIFFLFLAGGGGGGGGREGERYDITDYKTSWGKGGYRIDLLHNFYNL